MQRVFECELVVFCGAAARLRRAAAHAEAAASALWALAAAQTSLFIQKVWDCKWYYRQALGTRPPLHNPPS
jgi:hypothetical protein